MNTTFTIFIALILFWILISALSYYFGGWHKWEGLFQKKFLGNRALAQTVYLRRFSRYNNCVRIGTDGYGVGFSMVKVLLFHKSFCIPWAQILTYEVGTKRRRSFCILHTTQGDIRIYGDRAEIIGRECAQNYVKLIPSV